MKTPNDKRGVMSSLTKEQAFDSRVLMMLAGQDPMSCAELARHLKSDPFTTRASLRRLKKAKEVFEIRPKTGPILYEKARGGYSPEPQGAA